MFGSIRFTREREKKTHGVAWISKNVFSHFILAFFSLTHSKKGSHHLILIVQNLLWNKKVRPTSWTTQKYTSAVILSISKIMISINATNSKHCTSNSFGHWPKNCPDPIHTRVYQSMLFCSLKRRYRWKCIFQMKPPRILRMTNSKENGRDASERGSNIKNENFQHGMQWTVKWRCHSTWTASVKMTRTKMHHDGSGCKECMSSPPHKQCHRV